MRGSSSIDYLYKQLAESFTLILSGLLWTMMLQCHVKCGGKLIEETVGDLNIP